MNAIVKSSITVHTIPGATCSRRSSDLKVDTYLRSGFGLAVLMSLMLFWTVSASAVVIFNNGASPPTGALFSEIAPFGPGQGTGVQIVADDFTLLAPATIGDVHWTGGYFGTNNKPSVVDQFTIAICNDSAGAPSTVAGGCTSLVLSTVSRSMTGSQFTFGSATGLDIYQYDVNVSPFVVGTGVHWISIYNNTLMDTTADWEWGFIPSGNAVRELSLPALATAWTPSGGQQDFSLTGVPEPASLSLLGLGLAGLAFSRRKQA